MTTQIIRPTSNVYNLQLQIPDEFIGKSVEVSFEQKEIPENNTPTFKQEAKKELDNFYDNIKLDFSNFKFNREEANQ